jgi:hypothetical protein
VRIFKNKWFAKFAGKEGISDEKLIQAVRDVDAGNIDADYGGGVIKQRIARPKEGKSGGYRSIILYRKEDKAFFVYGFAKSVMENIDKADVKGFKQLAKVMLDLTDEELKILMKNKEIEEVES